MRQTTLTRFGARKPLGEILKVPAKVESVYSLTQHVWAGRTDQERRESKKNGRVRLETLGEFYLDPVRSYLDRICEKIAAGEGQGFWLQAEFGVGKSHLIAATAVMALGGSAAWDRVKAGEDQEAKAGPGSRLDENWRRKIEGKRIFPVVLSLEGAGGTQDRLLEDFILEEAQDTFALREGKPLAVYPEEHLVRLFLSDHHRMFRDDLPRFLGDERLMQGLPRYSRDEFHRALGDPAAVRDAGRVLSAFYRHKRVTPMVEATRAERLSRAVRDILEAGYDGVFIAIDEMSEYLGRSRHLADDEDCLLTLSSTLAKAQGFPVWTLVAAQAKHTNPQKIIAPDRLRHEVLEHKPERFRDIVVQRTRTVTDPAALEVYHAGYRTLVPWVRDGNREEFDASFPFPPAAIQIIRQISTRLTGTRSTIGFLHRALQRAIAEETKELVPLWRVFDDLMSYAETPSTSSSGTVSIRSRFRDEVGALTSAQAALSRITDGQLARLQNRQRAERILNTLFLYYLADVREGLTAEQIVDAVCDLKLDEDKLDAQLGHYETVLAEMQNKLHAQIRKRGDRYEFVPRETGEYDAVANAAADRLRKDPLLLRQYVDRAMGYSDAEHGGEASPFAEFIAEGERQIQLKVLWHGQERPGRVAVVDLDKPGARAPEVDTHGNEDDFLVLLARGPMTDRQVKEFLKRDGSADPRVCVWAPAEPDDGEKATLVAALAHLVVANDNPNTGMGKDGRRGWHHEAHRAYQVLLAVHARGVARTSRTALDIDTAGGVGAAIERMARKSMDTCYRSRSIDFGPRKFDSQGAVKLVNGIVKFGKAVSEGDQLWGAVENFAAPLEIVHPSDLRRLDASGSTFCQAIRKRIEGRGGTPIDVKTVYNWFTGYDERDGTESPGLTRRMVDVYLLCLAQQGVIRIQDKKGAWIDRSTIAAIEFKPETLRGLSRLELPRAPDAWDVFSPYLEVLVGASAGCLGPRYDKATADDALVRLRDSAWPDPEILDRDDKALRELLRLLGREVTSPFDDLLLYWLEFGSEPRPSSTDLAEVFDSLRRAVLSATKAAEPGSLGPKELDEFRDRHRRWQDMRRAFDATRSVLLRAARLASAALPGDVGEMAALAAAQQAVRRELDKVEDLVVNPDTVQTRLRPRLDDLEREYLPAYQGLLLAVEEARKQLHEALEAARGGREVAVLRAFAGVPEAKRCLERIELDHGAPPAVPCWPAADPEAIKRAIRDDGGVHDVDTRNLLSPRDLARAARTGEAAAERLRASGRDVLLGLAQFLRSQRVLDRLRSLGGAPASVASILAAPTDEALAEVLTAMTDEDLAAAAKLMEGVIGDKLPKVVSLPSFLPSKEFVWDRADIEGAVAEFRKFLEDAWEEGRYLKLDRG
ncbi:MAG: hypothetical protein HY905_16985 [Deltaproteobacteria bacterium]|nr:hypothetical protein [Deltaproteobacteria bacterium]